MADADDTAKALLVLAQNSEVIKPDQLIAQFGKSSHFLTFQGERDGSFSANCNVLLCLLHTPTPGVYAKQTISTVIFLIKAWKQGGAKDKWVRKTCINRVILANWPCLLESVGKLLLHAANSST